MPSVNLDYLEFWTEFLIGFFFLEFLFTFFSCLFLRISYNILNPAATKKCEGDPKKQSSELLSAAQLENEKYRMGHTKACRKHLQLRLCIKSSLSMYNNNCIRLYKTHHYKINYLILLI